MSDLARNVQELLDREAIRQLPILYCHYVVTRNVDGIVNEIFAPDATYEFPAGLNKESLNSARGSAEIHKIFAGNLDLYDFWPAVFNHIVKLTGPDTANGYVYIVMRMGSQNYQVTQVGRYTDEYQRVDGVWKIQRRMLETKDVGKS